MNMMLIINFYQIKVKKELINQYNTKRGIIIDITN